MYPCPTTEDVNLHLFLNWSPTDTGFNGKINRAIVGNAASVKSKIGNTCARGWVTHHNLLINRLSLTPETESNSAI